MFSAALPGSWSLPGRMLRNGPGSSHVSVSSYEALGTLF